MKLKGSSLIETVIAITIITICSLIATLVYSNIIDATPPVNQYKYKYVMDELMSDTIENKDVSPLVKKINGFIIEKHVTHNLNSNLYTITFQIKDAKNVVRKSILVFKAIDEN